MHRCLPHTERRQIMGSIATWEMVISWAILTILAWAGLIKFIIYCIKHG